MPRASKPSGHEQVVDFLNNLEHPHKSEIDEVRQIILSVNDGITEQIKWKAPSFCFNNRDRITFNLQGNQGFRLIFHCGAKPSGHIGKEPIFEDTTGLLEWAAGDRAIVTFTSMDDVNAKKEDLKSIVSRWLEVTADYPS